MIFFQKGFRQTYLNSFEPCKQLQRSFCRNRLPIFWKRNKIGASYLVRHPFLFCSLATPTVLSFTGHCCNYIHAAPYVCEELIALSFTGRFCSYIHVAPYLREELITLSFCSYHSIPAPSSPAAVLRKVESGNTIHGQIAHLLFDSGLKSKANKGFIASPKAICMEEFVAVHRLWTNNSNHQALNRCLDIPKKERHDIQ